jgi:outer membrane protein TolC
MTCITLISMCLYPPAAHGEDHHVYTLTSEEAMDLAEKNSRKLELEHLAYAAEVRTYKLSLRRFFPSLGFTVSSDDSVVKGNPDSRMKRVALSLTQPITNRGLRLLERKRIKYELRLKHHSLTRLRDELADTVWNLYHRIIITRRKLRLQQETLSLAQQQLEVSRSEQKSGFITELELIETELRASELAITIEETRAALEKDLLTLKHTLGIPEASVLILEDDIETSYQGVAIGPDFRFFFDLACKRNLSLITSRFSVKQRARELENATLRGLPHIELEGTVFIEGESFPLHRAGCTVTVSFSFPTPLVPIDFSMSGGRRGPREVTRGIGGSGRVADDIDWYLDEKKQRLALWQEKLKLEDLEASIKYKIRAALQQYERKQQQLQLARAGLRLYRRRFAVVREKLELGEINRLTYVEAGIQLADAHITLLEGLLELIETERKLEKLIGLSPGELHLFHQSPKGGEGGGK